MGKKMKKKPLWLCLSLDKHPPFPFPPNLIKINHLPPSPYFTTESSPIPTVDDSSACSSVQHISAVFFYLRRSTWGSHDCFSSVSSVQPRPPSLCLCPGCDLWSCWEKSLRTYPTLNFKQRRENTSTVIQFNVVLFAFSLSHISLKSLCNNVTHTHTYWFIDYIMTPAVMFQSHVRSVMVQLPYLWPDWNLMKFFNEQSVCDSLWRARLNLHTLCACVCVCGCQCACLSVLQELKLFVHLRSRGMVVSACLLRMSVCLIIRASSLFKKPAFCHWGLEGSLEVSGEHNTPTGLAQLEVNNPRIIKIYIFNFNLLPSINPISPLLLRFACNPRWKSFLPPFPPPPPFCPASLHVILAF